MTVDKETEAEIRRLFFGEHWKKGTIVAQLGVRPAPAGEVYLRIETLAGEQSQVDWAHVGRIRVQGGVRPLY